MKRIALFLITNILVMISFSIVWQIFNLFYPVQSQFGHYYGPLLVFFFIWGMGSSFVSLKLSKWVAKKYYGVQVISPKEASGELRALVEKVHDLSRKSGLKEMPEVGIYDSPEVNAFATGPSKKNSLVAVSSGLLRQMDGRSVEGVLAHEVAHIANGDMVTMTLIQGVINGFVLFFSRILADLISSQMSDENESPSFLMRFALNIFFQILFGFLGMIVVAFFSRKREYRADLGAAKTAGKDAMIGALQSLKRSSELISPDKGAMATMKIASLASTHPSLDDRIQRLEKAMI